MKALFLSHEHSLAAGGGGQQQCTREYHDTLSAAGFHLQDEAFSTDRSWPARLRRRFLPAPYANLIPRDYVARLERCVRQVEPDFVFCNLYNFISMGRHLRSVLPTRTRLVLLSHGLASVDEVHAARIARGAAKNRGRDSSSDTRVGAMLRMESAGLPAFDHTFCLAEFEVEICRWLGARSASWLPRTVNAAAPLRWRPIGSRVGCVGTFDHPPNLEGLTLFCRALAGLKPQGVRLRLVTRSHEVAARLAAAFEFVDPLGPLESGVALEAEVATWNAFVHPIFCYAMGCSTKVATAMEWGLPILTTQAGLRGYSWNAGELPIVATAEELAQLALAAMETQYAEGLREAVVRVAAASPTTESVALQIRRDLRVEVT